MPTEPRAVTPCPGCRDDIAGVEAHACYPNGARLTLRAIVIAYPNGKAAAERQTLVEVTPSGNAYARSDRPPVMRSAFENARRRLDAQQT